MKRLLILACCLGCLGQARSATTTVLITFPALGLTNVPMIFLGGDRIAAYTNRFVPLPTDLLLLADPVNGTNAYVTWSEAISNALFNATLTGVTTNGASYFTNQTSGDLAGFGAGGLLESISHDSSLALSGTVLAVVGGNVTGIDAGNITLGTLNSARLPGTVTIQGNAFNGASELLQLDGSAHYPALDGSAILNLTPGNLSAGTAAINITGAANSATNSTNFFGTISGTNFSFSTIQVTTSPTNWILDCKGAVYQKISCSNNVNLQYLTNGPGALSIKFLPNGADRTLTFPTNWIFLSTNGLTLSGSLWSTTLTNAAAGNGARAGVLALELDDSTSNQTNVLAKFILSP